ncbi:MAG: D-glycero-beta-D-manno-heptose 1-phosphate adenylyltransferase [archaeon]
MNSSEKVKDLSELKEIVSKLKKQGKKIVTTNGCFDLLHVGHVIYLEKAREFGDVLIVGINSDESVKKLKGKMRPLMPERERSGIIAALESVNYVFVFDESNPIKFIEELKPDFHVKGGDYREEEIIEKKAIEENGGKLVLLDEVDNASTSNIIKKIRGL